VFFVLLANQRTYINVTGNVLICYIYHAKFLCFFGVTERKEDGWIEGNVNAKQPAVNSSYVRMKGLKTGMKRTARKR
jgi:hypothetical protein